MKRFNYVAQNRHGRKASGIIETNSKREAIIELEANNLVVVKVVERKEGILEKKILEKNRKLKPAQKAQLFRELSHLIAAGYTIQNSFLAMLQYNSKPNWQYSVKRLSRLLDDTASFSKALEVSGDFKMDIIYQIRSGELNGKLEEMLSVLSTKFDADNKLERRLKNLMIYPAILAVALVIIMYLISTKIAPQMLGLVTEMGGELPALSRATLATTSFITNNGLVILASFILCWILSRMLVSVSSIRYVADRIKLKLPVFGEIFKGMEILKFTRVFGSMYEAGAENTDIFECSINSLSNTYLISRARKISEKVLIDGMSFPDALELIPFFSVDEISYISVGVKTGKLSKVLKLLTERNAEELDLKVERAVSIIQPLLIIIFGGSIGLVFVGMYLPMFSITEWLS